MMVPPLLFLATVSGRLPGWFDFHFSLPAITLAGR
jgi:hypothetical protein